jgi:PPOX class probable F420-dependent enzyme
MGTPLPPEVDAFLSQPHPAVMATLRLDGSPHTAMTWFDWQDGRLLVNMDDIRQRVRYLRRDGRVSITVFDPANWYRHVTLFGRVISLDPDDGLSDYQRLARRYGREPGSLSRSRLSAWIDIEGWYAWDAALQTPR